MSKGMTKKARFKNELHELPALLLFVAEVTSLSPKSLKLSFIDSDGEVVILKDQYDMEYFVENSVGRTFAVVKVDEVTPLNLSFNVVEDEQAHIQSPQLTVQQNLPQSLTAQQIIAEADINKNEPSETDARIDNVTNESALEIISVDYEVLPEETVAIVNQQNTILSHQTQPDKEIDQKEQLAKSLSLDSIDEIKQLLNNAMLLRMLLSEKETKNETKELQIKISELEKELKEMKEKPPVSEQPKTNPVNPSPNQSLQSIESQIIHKNSWCAKCRTFPITGKRFKCLVCPNYSLCQGCEAIDEHSHPMIKCSEPVTKNILDKIQNKFTRYSKQETKVQKKIASLPYELFYESEETPNDQPKPKTESRRLKYKKNKQHVPAPNYNRHFKEYKPQPTSSHQVSNLPKHDSIKEAREEKRKIVRFMLNSYDDVAIDELVDIYGDLSLNDFVQVINENFRSAYE